MIKIKIYRGTVIYHVHKINNNLVLITKHLIIIMITMNKEAILIKHKVKEKFKFRNNIKTL